MQPFFDQIRQKARAIDWALLLFLVLLLNVKVWIKVPAILLLALLQFNRHTGFRIRNPRLPLFYPAVIIIALIGACTGGYLLQPGYAMVLGLGILYWLMALLAIHQIKTIVERNGTEKLHHTILAFFIINIIVSIAVYAGIVWETGTINPYRYQGQYQKYFIGTGDYIRGISFDTSTTNAVLNAFGVVYFLRRRQFSMTLCCMGVLLLTGSNIVNLLLVFTLVLLFVFRTRGRQKSIIIVCLLMLVVFMARVSPQNNQYVTEAWKRLTHQPAPPIVIPGKVVPLQEKPDSILTAGERREKTALLYLDSMHKVLLAKAAPVAPVVATPVTIVNKKPVLPQANIHTPAYQHKPDTTPIEKKLLEFAAEEKMLLPTAADKPGKWLALQQTIRYLSAHPLYWLTGSGMGNFSSKLAFRATALQVAGGYPRRWAYIHPDFRVNHLDLYLYYFTRADGLHSVTNSPNSVYDQLLAEYGIAGLAAFFFLYIGYFLRHYKKMTYGIPVLLLVLGACGMEYWFEQLSVLPFAELLLLLNIKEGEEGIGA